MKFTLPFVTTLGSFIMACGAFMLTTAFPAATIPAYAILALACIAGLYWWLHDGDIRDGLTGGAIAIGIVLAAVAKWRGVAG